MTPTAGCCDMEGRPRAPRRLPGGPRIPARGAADAVRGDVRSPLVHGGGRARRRDHRPLPRRRARRLLHDRAPTTSSCCPAQGPGGLADPVRELVGRVRPAAAGRAVGRGALRAARARGAGAAVPVAVRHPGAFGHLLRAADFYPRRVREVAIIGGGAGRTRCCGRPRAAPAAPRTRRRRRRRDAVPLLRRPRAGRRPRRRLRLRAVRLPGAGQRRRRAARAALSSRQRVTPTIGTVSIAALAGGSVRR